MNEKEARTVEIKKAWVPGNWDSYELGYKRGYLEAMDKAKGLEKALRKIYKIQPDPELGMIVGSEHYEKAWLDCAEIARKGLAKWEKEK